MRPSSKPQFVAKLPNEEQIAEIDRVAREYFTDAAITEDGGVSPYDQDPFSNIVVERADGTTIGFSDYYCFTRDTFTAYTNGALSMDDMFSSHYLTHPDARHAEVVYISTVFRYGFDKEQGIDAKRETKVLLWSLAHLIGTMQTVPRSGLDIYSYGFFDGKRNRGEKLLRYFGFQKTDQADPDGNVLWAQHLVTAEQIAAAQARYRHIESLCEFQVRAPS